jgi:hypothetical protein
MYACVFYRKSIDINYAYFVCYVTSCLFINLLNFISGLCKSGIKVFTGITVNPYPANVENRVSS